MPRTAMRSKKRQPLATIARPVKAKIYRARFRPFESTKYLDAQALRRVAKAIIEIGTLEAPGLSCPLAAEIRKGMITRLKPVLCCGGSRAGSAQRVARRV